MVCLFGLSSPLRGVRRLDFLLQIGEKAIPFLQRRLSHAPTRPHEKGEQTCEILQLNHPGSAGVLGTRREMKFVLPGEDVWE